MLDFQPTHSTTILGLITTTVLLPILIIAYRDYRSYVAMGPHGLPDTLSGYIQQLLLTRRARKDTTLPAPYSDTTAAAASLGPHATRSFFPRPLPFRRGPPPAIPGFVAPQRQTTQQAGEAHKLLMTDYLDAIAARTSHILQRSLSRLEKHALGLQLASNQPVPGFLSSTRGELMHIHPADGSMHVVLSLADSKTVIEKGWGRRHRLSGGLLPWSYTLIYAPRDGDEMEIWKGIVEAGVGFGTAEVGEVKVEMKT